MSRDNALTWPNILPGIKPTHCPVGVILQHVGIFANHVLCPNVTDKNIKNNCYWFVDYTLAMTFFIKSLCGILS